MCPSPVPGSPAVTPPWPADRCPGILRLHEAADGHLVRVRLPGGIAGARALRAVADVAAHGNGIVELTSRAGLQVRGLAAGDAGVAADLLWRGGLLPSPAHDRVRNIVAPADGGRGPAARATTDAVVAALDAGLCADPALAALPGRILFAVQDGTGAPGGLRADVAVAALDATRWALVLDGRPTTLSGTATEAVTLALAAARAFLRLLDDGAAGGWRIADLPDGAARVAAAIGGGLRPADALEDVGGVAPGPRAGSEQQADGLVAATAVVPLGRLDDGALRALAALLDDLDDLGDGATLRVAPGRTVTVVDVPEPRAAAVVGALHMAGLATEMDSGWDGLSACAGLGACAKARVDVRAVAARRGPVRRGPDGSRPAEHWSGCERGCGRPASARATVVRALERGVQVDRGGTTSRVPDVAAALALLADGGRA